MSIFSKIAKGIGKAVKAVGTVAAKVVKTAAPLVSGIVSNLPIPAAGLIGKVVNTAGNLAGKLVSGNSKAAKAVKTAAAVSSFLPGSTTSPEASSGGAVEQATFGNAPTVFSLNPTTQGKMTDASFASYTVTAGKTDVPKWVWWVFGGVIALGTFLIALFSRRRRR